MSARGSVGVAIGAVVVFGTACSPADRVLAEVKSLCGAEFDIGVVGCKSMVDHGGWFARARFSHDDAGEIASVQVGVAGSEREVEEHRSRALAVVGPLLDDRQRDVAKRAVARLVRDDIGSTHQGTRPMMVGNAGIGGVTEVEVDRPWERTVTLEVFLNADSRGPMGELPDDDVLPVPPEEFATTMGALDDPTIAAWEAMCRDDVRLEQLIGFTAADPEVEPDFAESGVPRDRWNRGEMWIRCNVGDAREGHGASVLIDATWDPATRGLLYARFHVWRAGRVEGLRDLLETLLVPLLTPAQRDTVREAARTELPGGIAIVDQVHVRSAHGDDLHAVTVIDGGR